MGLLRLERAGSRSCCGRLAAHRSSVLALWHGDLLHGGSAGASTSPPSLAPAADLRRCARPQQTIQGFATYILFVYATALNLSCMFRMFAAFSPGFEEAIRFCGICLNILVMSVFGWRTFLDFADFPRGTTATLATSFLPRRCDQDSSGFTSLLIRSHTATRYAQARALGVGLADSFARRPSSPTSSTTSTWPAVRKILYPAAPPTPR